MSDTVRVTPVAPSFEEYVRIGNETTAEILDDNGPALQALRAYDDFLRRDIWAVGSRFAVTAIPLSMNAYMLFLSGVRIAMTGHVVAVFPLLRTALESACYAYMIAQNPPLERVWLDRHKDEAARKLCRKEFNGAVKITVTSLNQAQPEAYDWIADAYESAIDFGGHPNTRAVMGHVALNDVMHEAPAAAELSLTGLYAAESFQMRRSLVACLDYGLAIAFVLSRAISEPTPELQVKLNTLNKTKNNLVAAFVTKGYFSVSE